MGARNERAHRPKVRCARWGQGMSAGSGRRSVVRDGSTLPPIDLLAPLLFEPPDLSALEDEQTWNRIKEYAGSYGVGALVAYAARSQVSKAERLWCDRMLVENWTRHERMLGHLAFVLRVLAGDGIPAIAL